MALLAAFYIPSASATHDFAGVGDGGLFELDNNAFDNTPTPGGDDWSTLTSGSPTNPAGNATEQTAVPVTDAVNSSTDDTFCGGTKEKDDIAAWKWCNNATANDKNDLEHAYSAIYTVPNTATGTCGGQPCSGDKILYVGADRFANNGDSGLGFMFLQTGLAGNTCPAPSTGCTFNDGAGGTPHHTNGDLYVVSQFTGGGEGVTVDFYEWTGGTGGSWSLLTSGVDCDAAPADDIACATVFGDGDRKTNLSEPSPWTFTTKFPGAGGASQFAEGTFFEGGVNLTAKNISGCFRTILVDTSQSQPINESDQDFVMAPFEGCTSGITTTPQTAAGSTLTSAEIPAAARVDVKDHAAITVGGTDTFGGTVKFFLCGPFAANYAENCSTGGVQIGSPAAGESVTGTNGAAAVDSDTATLTSVGKYCWRAEYSGDSQVGVPGSTDPSKSVANGGTQSECFTITPKTPTLSTTASADVLLGNAITDTATLSGTAKQPGTDGVGPGGTINATSGSQANAGGSITWTVKGPDSCNASGLTVTGTPATVSGDATYGPVSATPTAIGKYTFVAQYINPTTNTNAAGPSSCPPGANDGDEEVNVTGAASLATAQKWLPNDTAHVTSPSGTTLAGDVTFQLYNDATCGTSGGTAQFANPIVRNIPNDATGSANDRTVATNNTTVLVTVSNDATAWSWKVAYNDTALQDPADKCESTSTFTLTDG